MVFVRKVLTGSGATAVQVVRKQDGKVQVIHHVGSAHTPIELGILWNRAQALADQGQGTLDLGAAGARDPGPLASNPTSAETAHSGAVPASSPGSARVVGMASDVLWDVLRGVYADLGFDVVNSSVFELLVLARLVEPTSLRDTVRVLTELGIDSPHRSTMHRHLRRVIDEDFRSQIAVKCFEHARASGDISLVLYDVTTLYFEAEHEDELRKVGYSKERRVDPQIVVGLLVDRGGFPLEIGCFEGNHAETRTLIPIVRQFQERHGLADLVIVADAGMLSTANLTALDAAGLRFIVGSRKAKAPGDLASYFHWHGDALSDGQVIDTITPHAAMSRTLPGPRAKRAEPVWDPQAHPNHFRAVWSYSRRRAVRDGHTLTAQQNRAQAIIDGQRQVKSARFVKTSKTGQHLDQAALDRERKLVGLKGYVTNIPAGQMGAGEVIGSYHDLWHVEQSFRMSKTDLRARPMFHRQRDAIEAHLTIVFAALAVARELQARTGVSIRKLVQTLRPLRAAIVEAGSARQTIPAQIPDSAAELINTARRSGH